MADIQLVVRDVRLYVQQCPDFTIERAVRWSVREFCNLSWYYQATLHMPLIANQEINILNLSGEDEVIAVKSVEYNNLPLGSARAEDLYPIFGSEPTLFYFEPPYSLGLYPVPSEDGDYELKVRLVLQPKADSEVIPKSIFRHHEQTIISGALYYLYDMPGEIWSDANKAEQRRRLFMDGVNRAKGQQLAGHVSGSTRVAMRSFL